MTALIPNEADTSEAPIPSDIFTGPLACIISPKVPLTSWNAGPGSKRARNPNSTARPLSAVPKTLRLAITQIRNGKSARKK